MGNAAVGQFAKLFNTYFIDGLGRDGPGRSGREWTPPEFAERCGYTEEIGLSFQKNVRNWLNDEALPSTKHLTKIEWVFWGDDENFQRAKRMDLRRARRADIEAREANPPSPFKAFGSDRGDPFSRALPANTKRCYEDLFLNPKVRDKFAAIRNWVLKGHRNPDADWVELLCTMEERRSCIAFSFFSLHRPSQWWFGNYYGVLDGWRDNRQADDFIKFIRRECEQLTPEAKGVVFEAERFDEEHLKAVLKRCQDKDKEGWQPDETISYQSEDERRSVEAMMRIGLYNMGGALPVCTVSDAGFRYVDYIQPAMEEPLDEENEVPLWLMVYPFKPMLERIAPIPGRQPYPLEAEGKAIFDFLYDEVYPSAYDGEENSETVARQSG